LSIYLSLTIDFAAADVAAVSTSGLKRALIACMLALVGEWNIPGKTPITKI